jgi:hypothetical protein
MADDRQGASILRYVVLRHEGVANPHFDLMFETATGSELATWRSERWPIDQNTSLSRLPDHRPDYLSYEGPISGNRGHVKRVAAGECSIKQSDEQWIVTILQPQRAVMHLKFVADDQWQVTIQEK